MIPLGPHDDDTDQVIVAAILSALILVFAAACAYAVWMF